MALPLTRFKFCNDAMLGPPLLHARTRSLRVAIIPDHTYCAALSSRQGTRRLSV